MAQNSDTPDGNHDGERLLEQLRLQTEAATDRVYQLDSATPLDQVTLDNGCRLMLKREDASTVHSYKWRGAFNKIAFLHEQGFRGNLIAASAGNHAQGVALAAKRLKLKATIFMPVSTPKVKQQAVKNFGGDLVEIQLHGDKFDEAAIAAKAFADQSDGQIIAPYDDLLVVAGQSTIGVEIVNQLNASPSHIFLPIGGGGMAAGVASVLRPAFPDAKLIGVEASQQNSMGTSILAGQPTTLPSIDRFCDGTAVARPGKINFEICQQLLDDYVSVDNDQVCQAIQYLWNKLRIIVEPSAALGVAAARNANLTDSDLALTVLSGSNVDFMTLPQIAKRGQDDLPEERYFCFEIGEKPGQLIGILDHFFSTMNIIDFQYGKVANEIAFPVIGIEVPRSAHDQLEKFLNDAEIPPFKEVTGAASVDFRVIPFRVDLLHHPFFAVIGFPNRPGALRDFMRGASEYANVCYLNFVDSGQELGQALMGFETETANDSRRFRTWLEESQTLFEEIPMETIKHLSQSDGGTSNFSADFIRRKQAP
jgi:threonine dehydratase